LPFWGSFSTLSVEISAANRWSECDPDPFKESDSHEQRRI
jgi:hypothetical protein